MIARFYLFVILLIIPLVGVSAEEPSLPLGLLEQEEPSLPPGLGPVDTESEQLGMEEVQIMPFEYKGFIEGRGGVRAFNDKTQKRASIGEGRLQVQIDKSFDWVSGRITTDFVADPIADTWVVDLENGDGFLDLRESYLLFRLGEYADLKLGRQIVTWGTGDYLFINDLFPKDWNSFFIGRDDEYLKAPSDALRLSVFFDEIGFDFVYTPQFDADRFIDGRRLSFFNPQAAEITGRNLPVTVKRPLSWFHDDEFAARLYRSVLSYEVALYGYYGFWKSPAGFDVDSQSGTFPALSVYGASVRGPLLAGIANIEVGYYDSLDDREGDSPFVRNSELRVLAGYEQEIAQDFSAGAQYYLEKIVDYNAFRKSLPDGAFPQDEYRQLLTIRLTRLLLNQNLIISLFSFYSPTDRDTHPRISASYKLSDSTQIDAGANFFFGDDKRSFFSMFEDNSNFYLSLRHSFIGGD